MRRAAIVAWRRAASLRADTAAEWERLKQQGVKLNPCGSAAHPAVAAGVVPPPPADAPRLSVQEAYDPHGVCFACGPSAAAGLRMRSFRSVRCAALGLQVSLRAML
jgi:hypothetical protein